MTKQEFIEAIAKAAIKYAPKYGIAVVSPVIAQACLESAYGTSDKAKHHNYFGLKYRKDRVTCHSGYFKAGSKEQKADGTYYPVTDDWYAFDSLESGVEGYFQFINISNYANLKGVTDPYKYLKLIREDNYATDIGYVKSVWAVVEKWDLTKYDNKQEVSMGYTNSSLVSYTKLSPNHSGQRTHAIDRITPHCVVGQLSCESICDCFPKGIDASCNYGIGKDGRISLCVEEKNRSWCSSSAANDQRAITIECASGLNEPYEMNDKVYQSLINLCVDICKRNGKKNLLWFADKNKSLNYIPKADEMVLTVHRWFANKSCPGDWLYSRLGDVATKVTAKLGGTTTTEPEKTPDTTTNNFPAVPFTVNVKIDDLNYRGQPSMDGAVKGQTGKGVFTIIEVNNGWGKLKSGAGWIWLGNPQYCTIGDTVKTSAPAFSPYKVRVSIKDLNIRKGPGTNYASNGFCPVGVYTIIKESDGAGATKWGKLKSGAGWISLDYAKRV